MRRLFLLLLVMATIYFIKPLWEEPVSKYFDISFLEPFDEKVETFLTSESVTSAIDSINDTVDKAYYFLSSKTADKSAAVDHVDKPKLVKPMNSKLAIYNIELGTPEAVVVEKLGEPNRISLNEYGSTWNAYHDGYHNFMMLSYDKNDKVNAIYTNDDLISSDIGIEYGSAKSVVRETFGEPLKEIRKGLNIYILQDSEEFDVFEVDGMYAYVFYDLHKDDTVTAMQLVSTSLERKKTGMYAGGDQALRNGFEAQLFDLTNAARVRNGLAALEWDDPSADTARMHSVDMADNNYFSHDNLEGKSPFDRMKDNGIKFRSAGENLAYGQTSSIFAHEGLMNSKGHRDNILQDIYSHLGTGVAFNEKSTPFYTETFLLK
jgi:uncharacterized protein YkwD